MSFPSSVADKALVACGRCCCLCHKFCGGKIELNHIIQDAAGGPDTLDNCIPVCFDCHADIGHYNKSHPRGKKYTVAELRGHREAWYAKVAASGGPTASDAHLHLDRRLFARISEILPIAGSMAFVSELNVETPFCFKELDDLPTFWRFCERPDAEFMDADLDAIRTAVAKAAFNFHALLGQNTFPCTKPHDDQNELPPEWHYKQPKRYHQVVDQLCRGRKELLDCFDALVKAGRRKLGVEYSPLRKNLPLT